MKKLLFFLIGFCLAFVPVHMVYASIEYDQSCMETWQDSKWPDHTLTKLLIIPYNADTWWTEFNAGKPDATYTNSVGLPYGANYITAACRTDGGLSILAFKKQAWASGSNIYVAMAFNDTVMAAPTDNDGDGIPNELDRYPDDPTPYEYKKVGCIEESSTGVEVYCTYVTDRGDFFSLGLHPDDSLIGPGLDYTNTVSVGAVWGDPADLETGSGLDSVLGSYGSDMNTGSTEIGDMVESTQLPGQLTGSSPVLTSTPVGLPSDPADTAEASGQKTTDNTAALVGNTDTSNSYLRSIDSRLASMNTRQSLNEGLTAGQMDAIIEKHFGGTTGDPGDTGTGDETGDSTAGEGALSALDPNSYYNETSMPTGLTAGPDGDYEAHGALEDETWVQSFLSNNPVKTAFDSSGFTLVSPVCALSFALPKFGPVELSLCEFTSEFNMAGNILFGFTALLSLFVVARGM